MTDVNNFILMFYICFNMFDYCLMVSYYIIYILYIFLNILLCMYVNAGPCVRPACCAESGYPG